MRYATEPVAGRLAAVDAAAVRVLAGTNRALLARSRDDLQGGAAAPAERHA